MGTINGDHMTLTFPMRALLNAAFRRMLKDVGVVGFTRFTVEGCEFIRIEAQERHYAALLAMESWLASLGFHYERADLAADYPEEWCGFEEDEVARIEAVLSSSSFHRAQCVLNWYREARTWLVLVFLWKLHWPQAGILDEIDDERLFARISGGGHAASA